MLPHLPLLLTFLAASFVLAVTPGPGVLYIVAASARRGRRAGLVSVAGIAAGNFANALAASAGLGALLALSAAAFLVVKFLGAGYLIYLGLNAILAAPAAESGQVPAAQGAAGLFPQGVVVALLNPKTMIFFAAFLPQFIDRPSAAFAQTLVLSLLFVAVAAVTDSLYALAAGTIGGRLAARSPWSRLGRKAHGVVLIALGVLAALSPRPVLRRN